MSEENPIRDRYRKDRAATAAMLGYDINDLTAAQSVRLDRAISLRLLIDDIQLKQLHGEVIDAKELVVASESLERLCGGQPEQPHTSPDFSGAREELANFFVQRAERIEAREARESERLREQNASLREEIAQLRTQLKAAPQPAPPNNVVPIDATARANATKPPAHYLRDGQVKEPWERGGRFEVPSWPLPR